MTSRSHAKWLCLLLLTIFILPPAGLAQKKEKSLVGEETLYFSLPSTQDRLINYLDEYYGKHHLIVTFFPAALTPV